MILFLTFFSTLRQRDFFPFTFDMPHSLLRQVKLRGIFFLFFFPLTYCSISAKYWKEEMLQFMSQKLCCARKKYSLKLFFQILKKGQRTNELLFYSHQLSIMCQISSYLAPHSPVLRPSYARDLRESRRCNYVRNFLLQQEIKNYFYFKDLSKYIFTNCALIIIFHVILSRCV